MKRLLLSLIATSIMMLASFPTQTQALFGVPWFGETVGGCWNEETLWPLNPNAEGVAGRIMVWDDDISVWHAAELVTLLSWDSGYYSGQPGVFLTAGYNQLYSQLRYKTRGRLGSWFPPFSNDHGPAPFDNYVPFAIMRIGSYWYTFIWGFLQERIPLPYTTAALKGDCSTNSTLGAAWSFFAYLEQDNGSSWGKWDAILPEDGGWIVEHVETDNMFWTERLEP